MGKISTSLINAVVNYLLLKGHYAWSCDNSANYNPELGFRVKNKSHLDGVADVCGVHRSGTAIFVEVKIKRDKPSDAQKAFRAEVEKRGGIYLIAKTLDDIMKDKRF